MVCRCVANPLCPDYVLTGWQIYTGNAYTSVQGQNTSFTQFEASDSGSTNPPLSFADTGTKFCLASAEWLLRSTPGCAFTGEEAITGDMIATCMGAPQDCTPSLGSSNPCSRGVLAYVSADVDPATTFTEASLLSTPIGCVQGVACPCGKIAVYTTAYGSIACIDPPSS